jgi:hypothetical protein
VSCVLIVLSGVDLGLWSFTSEALLVSVNRPQTAESQELNTNRKPSKAATSQFKTHKIPSLLMMMKSKPPNQFTCKKEREKRRRGKLRKKRRPKVWQQSTQAPSFCRRHA